MSETPERRPRQSKNEQPPLYPFPSDEVLWPNGRPDFDPAADSYLAQGRLSEDDVRVFNGREHVNPYRLAIRTPVRGSSAMFVNTGDLSHLLAIAIVGLANDDSGMYGPKGETKFVFSESYWENFSGIDIEVVGGGDE
ncbi:hypothetical protein [Halomarina litorea]|uniref:hypothetical protein n=1 Tax=Halomarina litorea TaxID=2961595 RepID=UPI0020C49653|nr:hypothetical protein [Halomarina sp. BCD28]